MNTKTSERTRGNHAEWYRNYIRKPDSKIGSEMLYNYVTSESLIVEK
jgi:hypothetical protein